MGRGDWMWRALAVLGVFAAVVLWLLSWVGAAAGCRVTENVACVQPGVYNTYQGRIFDFRGRPVSNLRLLVSSPADQNRRSSEPASTDAQGRFCIHTLAFTGPGVVSIAIGGERYPAYVAQVRSSAPVDPRLADPAKRAALRKSPNYNGPNYLPFVLAPSAPSVTPPLAGNPPYLPEQGIPVTGLWNARTDATQDCTTVATHALWWRTADAQSTWQFTALTVAPLVVIGMFLFAALENRSSRKRSEFDAPVSAYRACAIASVLNLVLFLGIWVQLI